MKSLIVIPARGGSKGIPHKNIKELHGKPLIYYTIDAAREIALDNDICVTTDDEFIIQKVEEYGLKVPFKRPDSLATDQSGTYEVLLHALEYYESQGKEYDNIILLQCTSPFRKGHHIREAIKKYDLDCDMVVSVTETKSNPYYNCFEEDEAGYLKLSKGSGNYHRRQDCPKTWEYTGAIYIINTKALKEKPLSKLKKIRKYEMDNIHSVDIDTPFDWNIAEYIIEKGLVKM
ncbi:MAG: acylneuraminate cytidylyltransferase family protein [Bacteroidales bacterium]|nr:acylneuraminate cytidylyltransferase family protein [Bacteroidales bacterium]